MKRLFRNANIGIAVSMSMLVAGFAFLHGNEAALEVLSPVAFFSGLAVFIGLNIRDDRAQQRKSSSKS